MASSPSHKFGQMIGDLLEELSEPILREFCDGRSLFLDIKGPRKGVRRGKKLSWSDKFGNTHDLDFVIEKGATAGRKGRPVAFIEAAWRRYTKHSRNKSQEIQGALLPIAEKHMWDAPFLGAILAGIFTEGALNQLKSTGFEVLYLEYETIVQSFAEVGINARFDEATADNVFANCISSIEALSPKERDVFKSKLIELNKAKFEIFFKKLKLTLDRMVEKITIIPLFGNSFSFEEISSAANFIEKHSHEDNSGEFARYDIWIVFSNGDVVNGEFSSKERALGFLEYAI